LGAVVNVRDAAPLSAGLIFGGPAGVIAGCIGGLYRFFSVYWGAGTYTQLACSIATILAGLMAAGVRKWMFDDKKPNWIYGACIAIACEVIHMILIFVTNMNDSSYAFEFVKGATLPMILGNASAVGISLFIISLFNVEANAKNGLRTSEWARMFKGFDPKRPQTDNVLAEMTKEIESWGKGARGVVGGKWKASNDGEGHYFNFEVVDGKCVFVCPQTAQYDVSYFFEHLEPTSIIYGRTDNLEPSDLIKAACKNKG
jgi:hypothetical protein